MHVDIVAVPALRSVGTGGKFLCLVVVCGRIPVSVLVHVDVIIRYTGLAN